jgi:hypothetical protein
MKLKRFSALFLILSFLLFPVLSHGQTIYKSFIGQEDMKWLDGLTATFSRLTSTGGSITLHKVGTEVDVAAAYGQGSPGFTALQNAINNIGSNPATIVLCPGTWSITGNLTIPSTMTLHCPRGVTISVSAGVTLTINGDINAGPYQIFSGSGTVTYGAGVVAYWQQWNGAGTEYVFNPASVQAPFVVGTNGQNQQVGGLSASFKSAPAGLYAALTIINDGGSPYTEVDLSVTDITLKDGSGNVTLGNVTGAVVNIATSGVANGLDTGAKGSLTWYYIWAISNGSTTAGLFSTSSTSPTMPSGYTYKALVGAIKTDGTGNFLSISQIGRYVAAQQFNFTGLSSGPLTISSAVPPTAKAVSGFFMAPAGAGNSANVYSTSVNGSLVANENVLNSGSGSAYAPFSIPLTNYPTIGVIASGGTASVYVTGWYF